MWVFGYGSLVWRPDFPFRDRRPAFVRGWKRRFWQGSTDHRGVPQAPGRVVTLLPEHNNAICWGTAYELEWDTVDAVVEHLDYRERGGYAREDVDIHFSAHDHVQGTVYIATTENENYLGEANIHAIATQIARSVGPSGANTEYLLRLAQALRDMGADDPHVYELERTVLGLAPELSPASAQPESQPAPQTKPRSGPDAGPHGGQADN